MILQPGTMRRAVSALVLLAAPALAFQQDQNDRNGYGVRTGWPSLIRLQMSTQMLHDYVAWSCAWS